MTDLLISRFWDNYAAKLKNNGIKHTAIRWYVRYVEKYIQKHPDKKLKYHTADDVSLYITSMQRVGHLKDWQLLKVYSRKVTATVHSMRFLNATPSSSIH